MINVILADHQKIFRIGMASALAAEDDIRIVGQPASPAQLVGGVDTFRPHVLVMSSAYLGYMDAIRPACDRQRTAMLLLHDYGSTGTLWNSGNFQGIMHRSADQATVVRFVRHLARGGKVVRLAPFDYPDRADEHVGMRARNRLTTQELEIIAHVVQGHKNREIAVRMGSTEPSVKNMLRRIFDKTGVYGRLELALYVLHHGMLGKFPQPGYASSHRVPISAAIEQWNVGRRPTVN